MIDRKIYFKKLFCFFVNAIIMYGKQYRKHVIVNKRKNGVEKVKLRNDEKLFLFPGIYLEWNAKVMSQKFKIFTNRSSGESMLMFLFSF